MRWVECTHDGDVKRIPLVNDPVSVGRAGDCDLAFPEDREVSRLHATVEKRQDRWYVVDQKSTNGTFVNGQRVTVPYPVGDGDLIQIGDQRLRIRSGVDLRVPESYVVTYAGYPHHYVILKVPPSSSQDQIDHAFQELSKIFSPAAHPGSEMAKILHEEIEEAYAILGDPVRRIDYDASLSPQFVASAEAAMGSGADAVTPDPSLGQ